jgi:hypothetical protein
MRRFSILSRAALVAALMVLATESGASARGQGTPHRSTLRTAATDTLPRTDPIARLQARIDSGREAFPFDSARGYLPALLHVLGIPASSQSLVFSRTSLQTDLIAPWSPRALYFNDDLYIGFVPESEFLEIATVSATKGAAFYTLDQNPTSPPRFKHDTTSCLMCHKSPATTTNVAGFTMLSTLADSDGYSIASVQTGETTDATPLEKRFGGWYVTGTLGDAHHAGNVRSTLKYADIADKNEYRKSFVMNEGNNRTSLQDLVNTKRYLERTSDVVALMVLVHQTSVHNLITALHSATTQAIDEDAVVRRYLGDTTNAQPLEATNARLRVAVDNLVRAMLFAEEAPLNGRITASSSFARDFVSVGPRDSRGRSLRDFDLQHRLFKYPLSFLIYSEGFDYLPLAAKNAVYRRLRAILSGNDSAADYTRLSQADRTAILEILTATKPDFSATGWR